MIKTIILGTGYLSNALKKKIKYSEIYSAKNFLNIYPNINKNIKLNLVINSFYSSKELNNIKLYEKFVSKSFLEISQVIDILNPKKINKIIYTSSSSVYGSVNDNLDQRDNRNRYLYSYAKLYCENFVKNFCDKNKVKFLITRVFNLYGHKNSFSIINKILNSYQNKKKITIFNKGRSVRDYIEVNDVARLYVLLLKNFDKGIFDIGTGKAVKINEILKEIKFPKKNIVYNNNKNLEMDFSVANLSNYGSILKNFKFITVEKFFKIKNSNLSKHTSQNLNQLISSKINIIVYGAGYAGRKIAKKILENENENLIYFLDDDLRKVGKNLYNKKIISFKELEKIKNTIRIDKILIAIPSLEQKQALEIYEKLYPITKNISLLPSKEYFKNKSINLNDLIDINVEEILNRKIFQVNLKTLEKYKDKTVLITGGAGSIGSEICKQLVLSKVRKIIIIDQSEYNIYLLSQSLTNKKIISYLLDINNTKMLREIIKRYKVDFIFHAAAYKHVDLLENNHLAGIKNNFIGTLSLLNAIKDIRINLTVISTDKAVYPKNILGITKRASEIIALSYGELPEFKKTTINVVRFGNVFGSQGSAIETFVNQIKNQKDITLTSYDMKRYFMSIREACNLVIQSAILKYNNKIFVLEMGKQIKIIYLINRILKFYNKKTTDYKIKIIGPKRGEKNSENLLYSSKKIFTKVKKLFISGEKIKKIKHLEKIVNEIENNISANETNKALLNVKSLLKK